MAKRGFVYYPRNPWKETKKPKNDIEDFDMDTDGDAFIAQCSLRGANTISEDSLESFYNDKEGDDIIARIPSQVGGIVEPRLEFKLIGETSGTSLMKRKRTSKKWKYSIEHNLDQFKLNLFAVQEAVDSCFERLFAEILKDVGAKEFISGYLHHSQLSTAIFIKPQRRDNFKIETILNAIASVCQSNDAFLLNGELDIEVNVTNSSAGAAYTRKNFFETPDERAKRLQSIIEIKNNDNLCLPRALAVGVKYIELNIAQSKIYYKTFKNICRSDTSYQQVAAVQLCTAAGIDTSKVFDIDDVYNFQQHLNIYQLVVIDGCDIEDRLFVGPSRHKQIFLQYTRKPGEVVGHFDFIKCITGFMGQSFYCVPCHRPFSHIEKHNCSQVCDICRSNPPCDPGKAKDHVTCQNCNCEFLNQRCLENHIGNNMCEKVKRCSVCEVKFTVANGHKCNVRVCIHCGEEFGEERHFCYVQPLNSEILKKEDTEPWIYIIYDIETTQLQCDGLLKHVPILVMSQTLCNNCYNFDTHTQSICQFCTNSVREFFGENCVASFFNDIKEVAKRKTKIRIFAHNGRGFDFHFVLQEILKLGYKPNITMNGCKILKIDFGNQIRFIDSLSFLSFPLSALPKTFGIEDRMIKGFFPHYFTRSENYDYVGPLPAAEYYGCKYMKPAILENFESWYAEQQRRNVVFNFKEELIKYCRNDVEILTQAVLRFHEFVWNQTEIVPYSRTFTIAALGMEIFRTKFLSEKTIGVVPVGGYKPRKSSTIADSWLDYIEMSENVTVAREAKIGPYFVDGLVVASKTVYEFLGCYWHGCLCQKLRNITIHSNKTNEDLYQEAMKRMDLIERLGYTVIAMWECEFKNNQKLDPVLAEYVSTRQKQLRELEKVGRIRPRDCLFGGRTNNFKFIYNVKPGETIGYVDFRSLYPSVVKRERYPTGHPIVITKDFASITDYFGVIKCRVLPPKRMYLGILPVKINDKLAFPLCILCAEIEYQGSCFHTDDERSYIGTWCTPEVQCAEFFGYEITKIFEVYHYEHSTTSLFAPYMNMWGKVKQEASGYPNSSYLNDPVKQQAYVMSFKEAEDIILTIANILKNPTLRNLCKTFLNSYWGKWGQHPNLTKAHLIKSYHEYMNLVHDDTLEIVGELNVADEFVLVNTKMVNEDDINAKNTNVIIAAMVTTYARLQLLKLLQEIPPDCLLYCDTDSAIFVKREGFQVSNMGNNIGQLTDEIESTFGEGAKCVKFVSGGPKNYGLEAVLPDNKKDTIMKVKGLTLHTAALKQVSIGVLEDLIKEILPSVNVDQFQIRPTKQFNVFSKSFQKIYRVVSRKRRVVGNDTLPFGYCD